MAEHESKNRDDIEAPEDITTTKEIEEILPAKERPYDDVFGEVAENGPNYRSVGWLGAMVLMLKTQIGLGVLAIPSIFDTVGLIPGVLLIGIIAGIATWTSYMVGIFKLKHREVYAIDDAGWVMFGRVGREVFGAAFSLYMIFVAGSGILGMSIGFNSVSAHGTCTAVFVAVSAIVGMLFASVRTLSRITWIAWVGLFCIMVAILIVTIAVGIQDRPSSAPQTGAWSSDYKLFAYPSFAQGVSVVSSLIFACSATPAYFSIVAEMREPRYFIRSLVIAQVGSTLIYIVVGIVIYYFCGSYVASPALGSAGRLIQKVSYGIALPGLLATTTIFIHLPSKYIFVRLLRGSRHLSSNSPTHWISWIGCTLTVTLISYLIASGIPFFDSLVSLIGALLGAFLAYIPAGAMWYYDNWSQRANRNWKWSCMACWAVFIIVAGVFITVAGTYGSVISIIDSLQNGGLKPWTCSDNSNMS
ncbi:putative amino acid transporter (Mtr) [Aspergillus fijiensis CBS 313.89]|uniref:Amino acid transporter transmembrane domain-containing protein n=1 Tax=Aspergillus fijiensis CBS 313.89 TaxID=1448319 RepID=A0A8G1RLF4_9EURO|nr:uncharacterized protein BO72DRAFT_513368 [Aspergillus fijiensis CBS 313.89]RAK75440.1 hypothetical protein BO72DRAFT_513368 [Aspergillus fijiensis CBS 313.89]